MIYDSFLCNVFCAPSPVHQTAWLQNPGSIMELVNLYDILLTIVMCLQLLLTK